MTTSLVLAGGTVVTMDADRRIFRDGAIAVAGDRIVAVGPSAEIEQCVTAREVIDGRDRFVVTPGFVNCHIHITGEPITRGAVPDDTDWRANVFDWLIPTYLVQSPADEQVAATLAALDVPQPARVRGRDLGAQLAGKAPPGEEGLAFAETDD